MLDRREELLDHRGGRNFLSLGLKFDFDQDILRRDQIWFIEKGADGASTVYPLTDFKPRNDEVLERWYLRGRYGALPIVNEVRQ